MATDCKPEKKLITRSKSTFGNDITKKMNEPVHERYKFTNKNYQDTIRLPSFLKKAVAYNNELAPY